MNRPSDWYVNVHIKEPLNKIANTAFEAGVAGQTQMLNDELNYYTHSVIMDTLDNKDEVHELQELKKLQSEMRFKSIEELMKEGQESDEIITPVGPNISTVGMGVDMQDFDDETNAGYYGESRVT